MKFLILFCCIISLASAIQLLNIPKEWLDDWDQLMRPFRNECMCATGAQEADTLNFFKRKHFPNKPCFKCYLKCLYLRLKFIDEKGIVDTKQIAARIEGADLELVTHCELHIRNETDICEKVYSGIMCGLEKMEKLLQTEVK